MRKLIVIKTPCKFNPQALVAVINFTNISLGDCVLGDKY